MVPREHHLNTASQATRRPRSAPVPGRSNAQIYEQLDPYQSLRPPFPETRNPKPVTR